MLSTTAPPVGSFDGTVMHVRACCALPACVCMPAFKCAALAIPSELIRSTTVCASASTGPGTAPFANRAVCACLQIKLENNAFIGTVPSEIGNLSRLRRFQTGAVAHHCSLHFTKTTVACQECGSAKFLSMQRAKLSTAGFRGCLPSIMI